MEQKIDEHIVRLNAFFTMAILLVFLFTPLKWIIYFITGDFLIRGFFSAKISPLVIMNKSILKLIRMKPLPINATSKKFAAKLMFLFLLLSSLLTLLNYQSIAKIIVMIIVFFTFLEAFFGVCLACKIYPLVRRYFK